MKVIIEDKNGNTLMQFYITDDTVNADDILCKENCSIADVEPTNTVRIQMTEEVI